MKNGLYIYAISTNKKIEITLEMNLNGFSISLIQIISTKKAITIAKIWDKTTKDSILFIAKKSEIADHRKKLKNKIVTLFFKISFNGYSLYK